jgi:hypothetical protein
MGDVEAPNPCTVEAKRKAKWPPRGQATEHKRGPDRPPRGVPYGCDPTVLKSTGTSKPEGELVVLKNAAPGDLNGKTWYVEEEAFWEGLVDPQRPHFKATEPRSQARASSPAEKEDAPYKNQTVRPALVITMSTHLHFHFQSL